jgi:acyl carrier protein
MTVTQNTNETIKIFIHEQFLYDRPEVNLTPDLPLLEERLMDSLQLMQLVVFLEEKFALRIDITDLVIENFASINTISAFIEKLKTGH